VLAIAFLNRAKPVTLLILSIFGWPSVSNGQELREAWILGASSNEAQYFIDGRSLRYEGSEITGWSLLYLKNGSPVDGKPIGYGLIKNYWNCDARTHRAPRTQYYLRNGEASESYRNTEPSEEVLPSTLGAENLSIACKNAPKKQASEYENLIPRSSYPEIYDIISTGYFKSGRPAMNGQWFQYSDGQIAKPVIIRGSRAYWAQDGDCAKFPDGAAAVYVLQRWEAIECSAGPRAVFETTRLRDLDRLGFPSVETAVNFGKTLLPWQVRRQNPSRPKTTPAKLKAKKR
jgi:hypothetical protein